MTIDSPLETWDCEMYPHFAILLEKIWRAMEASDEPSRMIRIID